ncbi:S1 family peptidase [Bdellovibrio sp. HCB290]|uniref:S1 family peptidase n=1 Tax=Bdellovibrio sp. HCB290 TaxID=3394356 RepID=UPI0039B3F348
MKFAGFLTLLASLFIVACTPGGLESMRVQDAKFIIGGKMVKKDSPIAKSTVGIYDINTAMLCTGILLENNVVLTAAHCLNPDLTETFVFFTTDMESIIESYDSIHKSSKTRRVSAAVVHTEFKTPEEIRGTSNPANDIAILKFKGTVPNGYKPANFLTSPKLLKPGQEVIVAGYGVDTDEVTELDIEKTEDLQTLMDEGVAICYFDDDTKKERCVTEEFSGLAVLKSTSVKIGSIPNPLEYIVLQDKTHGPCTGDSGGPAFIKSGSKYFVWGITSRGDIGCSTRTYYTNILAYKTWIVENSARLIPYK